MKLRGIMNGSAKNCLPNPGFFIIMRKNIVVFALTEGEEYEDEK